MANDSEELLISIPGSCTLKEIKNVIRFHEGYLWKFKSSKVQEKMNIALLVAWDKVPPTFEFAGASTSLPAGSSKEWSGKLRYNGSDQTVVVQRRSG